MELTAEAIIFLGDGMEDDDDDDAGYAVPTVPERFSNAATSVDSIGVLSASMAEADMAIQPTPHLPPLSFSASALVD